MQVKPGSRDVTDLRPCCSCHHHHCYPSIVLFATGRISSLGLSPLKWTVELDAITILPSFCVVYQEEFPTSGHVLQFVYISLMTVHKSTKEPGCIKLWGHCIYPDFRFSCCIRQRNRHYLEDICSLYFHCQLKNQPQCLLCSLTSCCPRTCCMLSLLPSAPGRLKVLPCLFFV